MNKSSLSSIPSVDALLSRDACIVLTNVYGRSAVTECIRDRLSCIRNQIEKKEMNSAPTIDDLMIEIKNSLETLHKNSLRPVINLTGTILHTNMGRAILPQEAIDAISLVASFSTNLEYDLDDANRGDRDLHIEELITELTGAEAATLVNNNAAAVLLVLNTLAIGKEVPVSRGELVEIGGSFRIPDIIKKSGSRLVETGTTNRTHLKDYEDAINSDTALIMKVHTSNYHIQGFTKSVSEEELSRLAKHHQLPFVTDLGSGTLLDMRKYSLPYEPTVKESIDKGADIVTFSGDKLLGGPQAGIIAGKRDLIKAIKRNPLKRALRVDKMTIAALTETLKLYRDPDRLKERLPTLKYMTRSLSDIRQMAEILLEPMSKICGENVAVSIKEVYSQIGSGSFPADLLPSLALSLKPAKTKETGEKSIEKQIRALNEILRSLPVPIIGRIQNGELLLDLRCLDSADLILNQL